VSTFHTRIPWGNGLEKPFPFGQFKAGARIDNIISAAREMPGSEFSNT
jgi:hypothetical protein